MAEPQLSVRSAKARALAHRLARQERRSVAAVVERALEAYEAGRSGKETARAFFGRLSRRYGAEVDLERELRAHRRPHRGLDL